MKAQFPNYPAFHHRDIGSPTVTLDGIEYKLQLLRDGKLQGFAKVFRHGAVQMADGYTLDFREQREENRLLPHPGGLLMTGLLGSIRKGVSTAQAITGASSHWLDFRMRSRPGHPIAFYNDPFGYREHVADREEMILDPHILTADEDWEANLPSLCRPLFDQIWQAFGFDECEYFKADGQYLPN